MLFAVVCFLQTNNVNGQMHKKKTSKMTYHFWLQYEINQNRIQLFSYYSQRHCTVLTYRNWYGNVYFRIFMWVFCKRTDQNILNWMHLSGNVNDRKGCWNAIWRNRIDKSFTKFYLRDYKCLVCSLHSNQTTCASIVRRTYGQ